VKLCLSTTTVRPLIGNATAYGSFVCASGATGIAVAAEPKYASVAAAGVAVTVAAGWIVRRYDVLPRTGFQWMLGVGMVTLPLTPWLDLQHPGAGQKLRVSLAVLLGALLLVRAVPLARPRGLLLVLLCGFFADQLVAALLSPAPSVSYTAVRLVNWLMFAPLAFVRYDHRTVRVAVTGALAGAVIVAGGAALQGAGLMSGAWGAFNVNGSQTFRYSSTLENPNNLGLYMLSIAVVALLAFQRTVPKVAVAAGAGIVVMLSGSRGAFLALPVIAVYLAFARRGRLLIVLPALVFAVYLVAPVAAPQLAPGMNAAVHSVKNIIGGTDTNSNERKATWHYWLNRGTNAEIGAGYGGYTTDPTLLANSNRKLTYRLLTVDNSWLKLYLEEGLIGVALLLGVFLVAIRRTLATPTALSVTVGALLTLTLFRSLSVDVLDINPWNMYLWLMIGLAAAASRLAAEETDGDPAQLA
jgi:O-antigen ligase